MAACSSSPSTTSTTSSPPTSAASTSTSGAASTTSTMVVPTTASGSSRCKVGNLVGSVVGGSGAAGTIETTFALKSTATATCVLGGYPGLQMLSASGALLPTKVVRGGSYSFTKMAPTTVTVAPGGSVEFNVGYGDVPVGNETSCPSSESIEITPPNAYGHLVTAAKLSPCGGGTLVVSPVFSPSGPDSQTAASG
jgi:Protein of unknown function (DUF4232)